MKILGDSVRAKECNGYVDKNCHDKICCTKCLSLHSNTLLANRIAIPTPKPQNIKYTPLFWFENDPMNKYLQNADLLQIWNIVKGDELHNNNNSNVWLILTDKAMKGAFNDKPVFTGLCHVMVQAYLRKEKDTGRQNLKYPEEFTNFLVILASFSNRALDLFRQNLEGRSIQNIRYFINLINEFLL